MTYFSVCKSLDDLRDIKSQFSIQASTKGFGDDGIYDCIKYIYTYTSYCIL